MKKIHPPVLLLLSILGMFALNRYFPVQKVIPHPYHWTGCILFLIAFAMTGYVVFLFNRVDTEINTFKEPRKLVTEGLFRFIRNPIYLGFVLMLMGVAIFLGSLSPWLFVVAFFLISNAWYIPVEERNLETIFGEAYRNYKSKVRRWL